MLEINQAWEQFKLTSFYEELGLPTPSELRGVATHDLADHGVSPYEGDYIPTSLEGEVMAFINNAARSLVYHHKGNKKMFKYKYFYRYYLEPNYFYQQAQGKKDSTKFEKVYEDFFAKCILYWWDHPLIKEYYNL